MNIITGSATLYAVFIFRALIVDGGRQRGGAQSHVGLYEALGFSRGPTLLLKFHNRASKKIWSKSRQLLS